MSPKNDVVARVTVYGASEMTPTRRREVAAWLKRHASDLIRRGLNYPKRFTETWMAHEDDPIVRVAFFATPSMSPTGRKQIADWLRQHARDLMKGGDNYAPHFIGRFYA